MSDGAIHNVGANLPQCSRCVLPQNYPGVSFDAAGVCSNCHRHDRHRPAPLGEEALRKAVEPYRDSSRKHDCAFALSGGRDSTYSLYVAVKVLKLRPIAFTVDQGFIPDETWESMANATKALGVEHVIVKHDIMERTIRPMLTTWLKRPSPGLITFMCLGCRWGLYKNLRKLSYEYSHLPICLTGNGEPEEEDFSWAFYSKDGETGSRTMALARGIARDLLANPGYLVRPYLPWRMFIEGLYVTKPTRLIRKLTGLRWKNVDVLRYLPYEEQKIENILRNELGWKKYGRASAGWRSDCKLPLIKNAMYMKLFGFTRHDGLISGVVRRGLMTREEGLARLEKDNVIPEEFVREFFTELGLSYDETWGRARWDQARLPTQPASG